VKDVPRFLSYFRRRPAPLVGGFLTMVGSSALFLAMPRVVRIAIEDLQTGVTVGKLFWLSSIIVLLAVGDAICLFLTRRLLIGASRHIEYEMRQDLLSHLLRLPPTWHRQNRVGDLMSRAVNDLSAVRMMAGPGVMHGATTLVVGVASLVLMLSVSPLLTAVSLAFLPLVAATTAVVGKITHKRFTRIQEFFSEISVQAQEDFAGVRLVRAFAKEESEARRFDVKNKEFLERNLGLARLNALYFPALQLLVALGSAVTLYVGGRLILKGSLSVARYVEFNLYLLELVWPAIALGWVVNLWQRGAASWNRLVELWVAEPLNSFTASGDAEGIASAKSPATPSDAVLQGDVEVRGLSFDYSGVRSVLRDVSFTVPQGSTVALVGRTGAGKSTLLNLLLRLDEPPKGTVFIGGRDLTEVPLPLVRRSLVTVPQETFLFSDTLAANIAFGQPAASRAEIEAAALAAGLEPDLAQLPKGLDTMVGERGITLSGGQKQRTALARALLTGAPYLLLDDAFSSVDTETEARILLGLKQAVAGRTVFLVSHRLSTIQHADFVVVLENGRVAEVGTHAELLALGGVYAGIAERQRLLEEVEAA